MIIVDGIILPFQEHLQINRLSRTICVNQDSYKMQHMTDCSCLLYTVAKTTAALKVFFPIIEHLIFISMDSVYN